MSRARDDMRLLIGQDSAGNAHPLRTDANGRLEVLNLRPVVEARVFNSANLSIPNATLTVLTYDSELTDTDGMHDLAVNPGRLTCKVAGKYLIGGNVLFYPNATGPRAIQIRHNGSGVIALVQASLVSGTDTEGLSLVTIYTLGLNDYVELLAYQVSGGALNAMYVAAYSPVFWAVML